MSEVKKISKEQAKKQAINDIKDQMSTDYGRRIMWLLLSDAGIFRGSFVEGDSYSTTYNEGRRVMGLKFFKEIQTHCPDLYLKMSQENKFNK